jgi:hypothetical protein
MSGNEFLAEWQRCQTAAKFSEVSKVEWIESSVIGYPEGLGVTMNESDSTAGRKVVPHLSHLLATELMCT